MFEAFILCAVAAAYALACLVGMTLWERHKRIWRRWRIHEERRTRELAENDAAFQARLARQVWCLEAQKRELERTKNADIINVHGLGKVRISELMAASGK